MAVVAVLVPVRNEEHNVAILIDRLLAAFAHTEHELHILFVDDSSKGNLTPQVLEKLTATYSEVKLQLRPPQMQFGVTSAILTAYTLAPAHWPHADYFVVMDGDLQHPPEIIPFLIAKADEGFDFVVASRYSEGGSAMGLDNMLRHSASSWLRVLPWIFLPTTRGLSDPLSGCFLVKASALNLVRYRPIGWKVILEVAIMSPRIELMAEVPYVFQKRTGGHSKASIREGIQLLYQVFSLAFRRYGRYLKEFRQV